MLRQDIYNLYLEEFHCMSDTAESTHRPNVKITENNSIIFGLFTILCTVLHVVKNRSRHVCTIILIWARGLIIVSFMASYWQRHDLWPALPQSKTLQQRGDANKFLWVTTVALWL